MFTRRTEAQSRWLNTLHRRHEWLARMGQVRSARIIERLIGLATAELLTSLYGEGC